MTPPHATGPDPRGTASAAPGTPGPGDPGADAPGSGTAGPGDLPGGDLPGGVRNPEDDDATRAGGGSPGDAGLPGASRGDADRPGRGEGPAEAARRALRVARALTRPAAPAMPPAEREPAHPGSVARPGSAALPAAPAAGPAGARPSAAARAAIRRHSAVPGAAAGDDGPGEGGPGEGGGARPTAAARPGPAERAREALRAARAAEARGAADGGAHPTTEHAPVADRDGSAVSGDDRRSGPAVVTGTVAGSGGAEDAVSTGRTGDGGKAGTAEDAGGAGASEHVRHTGVTGSAERPGHTGRPVRAGTPGPAGRARALAEAGAAPGHPRAGGSPRGGPGVPEGGPPAPQDPAQDFLPQDPVPAARPRGVAGEHRLTFDRLPGREEGAALAGTPWGEAWLTALTERALDPARLARGRRYAEGGRVDAITVTPGLVLAYVHGSRPRPYRAQVRVRTLDDDEWEAFLDAVAERPGHIAALLDRKLPEALIEGGAGSPLLPRRGDLLPFCGCPDTGRPCKHAAALCYQTARLLDADPFALLLLRGRGEQEILDALSRRNAAHAARAAAEARAARERDPAVPEGVRAKDALSRAASGLPPLPAPLPPPAHPGHPPAYPAAPGGPDPYALDQLATHAAARAHALLTTGEDPVGDLTLWQDAVRVAAARPGSGLTAATRTLYSSLAAAAGRTPVDLARAVAAWRQGGPAGLAVLEGDPWDPPAGRFDRARPLLRAAGLAPFRPWRNRLTHPAGHAQLRLGQDNLWYAYESEPGADDWWPRGTADPDPVAALTALGPGLDPAELPPEPSRH
ncbi:SWIM zinc finger family protein [Streptomyces chilikensis]|uniref:SWIM zinc finger family protein n=1 Tax=Streptomyces chilikensis TaxID=1194079 RepID=A0ABV3ET81_9ACTN